MGEDIAYTSTCLHDFHRVTPTSSRPEFGRRAGRPAAHLLNYPLGPRQISNPPTDARETPRTNVLGTLSCHRWLMVAVLPPVWCTPGLAGSVGSQVLPVLHSSALLPLSFGDFLPAFARLLWTLSLAVASMPCNKTACVMLVLKGLARCFRSQGMAREGQPC